MNTDEKIRLFNKLNENISSSLSILCSFNLIDLKTRTDIENNLSMKLNEILKQEPKCRFCKKILDSDLYCDVCRCYGIEKEFK